MAMTYAALAKTLGLSLGRSTQASTSSQPSNAAIPVSTAVTTVQEETQAKTHEKSEEIPEIEPEPEPQSPSLKRKSDEGLGERPPTPVKKSKSDSDEGAVHVSSDEAGPSSDADAEGETDIASSRPPSPYTVPPQPVATVQQEESPEDGERPKIPSEDTEDVHETLMKICKSPVTTNNTAPSPPITPIVEEKTPSSTNDTPSHSSFPDKKLHSMTDEQLHQAKVLILDLLGWGVPPEYILQRGVSHALLYTVFTDLRLRLPDKIRADCAALVATTS